jgi:hypothetical protein
MLVCPTDQIFSIEQLFSIEQHAFQSGLHPSQHLGITAGIARGGNGLLNDA